MQKSKYSPVLTKMLLKHNFINQAGFFSGDYQGQSTPVNTRKIEFLGFYSEKYKFWENFPLFFLLNYFLTFSTFLIEFCICLDYKILWLA